MDLAMDVYIPEDYVRRRCKPNINEMADFLSTMWRPRPRRSSICWAIRI